MLEVASTIYSDPVQQEKANTYHIANADRITEVVHTTNGNLAADTKSILKAEEGQQLDQNKNQTGLSSVTLVPVEELGLQETSEFWNAILKLEEMVEE